MEETTGNAPSKTIVIIAVAIVGLVVGYFLGASQSQKTASPEATPKVVNPFEEGKVANPLEGVKNPFEGVKTNPFK